jgi:hypothetical protein
VDDESLARLAAMTEAADGNSAALVAAAAHARSAGPGAAAVVLVEGMSDQSALATLAVRRGRNLAGEGVFIVDELIRALGAAVTEQLIEGQGELGPFRTFVKQPAQRTRLREQQLRRFLGTRSGRKIHYGQVLADALDLSRVPRPLDAVLAHV